MRKWGAWVAECVDLLDGDGAFRHFPCPGALRDQPAYDMQVLRAVRQEWVGRMNDKIKGGGHGKGRR